MFRPMFQQERSLGKANTCSVIAQEFLCKQKPGVSLAFPLYQLRYIYKK